MRLRQIGLFMLLAAGGLALGVSLPTFLRAQAAEQELRALHATRARPSRRPLAKRSAEALDVRVRALRRKVLDVVERAGVAGVRLEIREASEGEPPLLQVSLSAVGEFVELAKTAGALADAPAGLAFVKVRLTPQQEGARLDVDALAP